MKLIIIGFSLLFAVNTYAQVKATQGNNSVDFTTDKQPTFNAYSTNTTDYFVICKTQRFEKINTIVAADKKGNIISSKELRINMGVMNNTHEVNALTLVGNTLAVFVEHHNKAEGKNTLTVQTVSDKGELMGSPVSVGSMDMAKMSNPGDWYVSVTPDKKHVYVISRGPHEKDAADQFKYVSLNDKLEETGKGQFAIAGNTKGFLVKSFLASDKGDFYITADENDKSYIYPVVYKASTAAATATMIPVMLADPGLRNFSYTEALNPAGELVIAGYIQQKKAFTTNEIRITGTYLFNSSKPAEVKTFMFDKPIANLTARNIVYNGDTFFLIGEQFEADKDAPTGNVYQRMNMIDTYTYNYGDIEVTAFTNDAAKKFDLPLSRKWIGHDFNLDLAVASGIINNKLALVYNEQYGKYIDESPYNRFKNNKLPVAVLINNDGLMDAPVTFAKEMDVKVSTYTLYPAFFNSNGGHMMLLSVNAQTVKTATFQ